MGRFTKVYAPEPLVLVVRVSEVCSSVTVTVDVGNHAARGIRDFAGDSAERLLCLTGSWLHNTTAAAIASRPEKEKEDTRMKCFKGLTSK